MRFAFVPCASLPKLAWCAQLERGCGVARVFHGPWLEIREDGFVEGAWTGAFELGELDRARFLVGSGAVLRADRVVFCTQSDLIERLYSIRVGAELFVSNSLVFLLSMTGDEPDPTYPFYYHDLRAHIRAGIQRKRKTLRTRKRREVELHDHCQLAIGPDLRAQRIEKPTFAAPASFGAYLELLQGVLAEVLTNAAAPGRRQRRYAGLATVSGGYDSNALAVLLAHLGVREAMTVFDGVPGRDSGAEVAQRLGMTVREYPRAGFRTTPGVDEAEFCAVPRGPDVVLGPSEEQLVGKLLVTGRYGDVIFGLDPAKRLADFQTTRASEVAGTSLLEFRLRVGFLNFNPLYAGGLHVAALHAIGASPEMTPWRLGGGYDRPIPRRILEEAGIPRTLFGVRKAASAAIHLRAPGDLSALGRADFETYRRAMPQPGWWRRQLTSGRRRRRERTSEMDFAMHWGHARIRQRYAEAVAARSQAAPGSPPRPPTRPRVERHGSGGAL